MNFTTNAAYNYVYWYVKSPSESGLGTNVKTDTGDGSTTTTAQLSYSFPGGVSGDYVITAYVYGADNSVYQTSYTVTVSSSVSTETPTTTSPTPTPETTTPTTPTFSISPYGSYTSNTTVNASYAMVLSASEAISQVKWYVSGSLYDTQNFYDSTTTSSTLWVSFSFTGENEVRVEVTLHNTSGSYSSSYTVIVSD